MERENEQRKAAIAYAYHRLLEERSNIQNDELEFRHGVIETMMEFVEAMRRRRQYFGMGHVPDHAMVDAIVNVVRDYDGIAEKKRKRLLASCTLSNPLANPEVLDETPPLLPRNSFMTKESVTDCIVDTWRVQMKELDSNLNLVLITGRVFNSSVSPANYTPDAEFVRWVEQYPERNNSDDPELVAGSFIISYVVSEEDNTDTPPDHAERASAALLPVKDGIASLRKDSATALITAFMFLNVSIQFDTIVVGPAADQTTSPSPHKRVNCQFSYRLTI